MGVVRLITECTSSLHYPICYMDYFNSFYYIYIFDLVGKKSQNYFAQTDGNNFQEPH